MNQIIKLLIFFTVKSWWKAGVPVHPFTHSVIHAFRLN
jgi:hypothetical protein